VCDLPIDKIAALTGVCRTTVQTTIHEARRLGHLKITERPIAGKKHLPNVVEIVSAEWRAWIKRAPSAARRIGSNSAKMVSTTKSRDLRKEEVRNESGRSSYRLGQSEPERGVARRPLQRDKAKTVDRLTLAGCKG
jgi:hypothetical protein